MIIGFFVGMCFGGSIGIFLAGLFAANRHAQELAEFGDDCYADGYMQCEEDRQHGVARLPTHRP